MNEKRQPRRREVVRFWWFLLALVPFGLLTWAAFLYAGVRAERPRWLVAALAYGGVFAFWGVFAAEGGGLATAAWIAQLAAWGVGIVHALLIRRAYLDSDAVRDTRPWGERPFARRYVFPAFAAGTVLFGLVHLAGAALEFRDSRVFARAEPCAGTRAEGCTSTGSASVVDTWWAGVPREADQLVVVLDIPRPPRSGWNVYMDEDVPGSAFAAGDRVALEYYGHEPTHLIAADGRRFRTAYDPGYLAYDRFVIGAAVTVFGMTLLAMLLHVNSGTPRERFPRTPFGRATQALILGSVVVLFAHLWNAPDQVVAALAATGAVAALLAYAVTSRA